MIRQLEELNAMVQAWIDRQGAEGCGGCKFEGRESWEAPCRHCKRKATDYWTKKEDPPEKRGVYG